MTINEQINHCNVRLCKDPMAFQIAKSRKSGKPFLMVKCLRDGRHFREFVGDSGLCAKVAGNIGGGMIARG